jgi:ABC-type lipoprotein export system ATPase subunit
MKSSVLIQKLAKSYAQPFGNSIKVLKDIDLEVQAGSFVSVIGHSGSGKTTLLNMLGLLDVPDSVDTLEIGGIDVTRLSQEKRALFRGKNIGFVFQFHQLLPEFNALQNVMLPMKIGGLSTSKAKERAMELLGMVFTENEMNGNAYLRKESQLSGGQCQRVAIARALANSPPLILADEPTGNLDHKNAGNVMKILKKLPEIGTTVLMITHQLSLADHSDCVYGMLMGKLVDNTTEVSRSSSLQSDGGYSLCCPFCNKKLGKKRASSLSEGIIGVGIIGNNWGQIIGNNWK